MSSMIARSLVLTAALIALKAASFGHRDEPPPQIHPTQDCGTTETYTAPGGAATGSGVSLARAERDAVRNAMHEISFSVRPCDICIEIDWECTGATTYTWTYQVGPVVLDPVTGIWWVTVTWDGCVVRQVCSHCPM